MAFYDRIMTEAATANGSGNITWTVAKTQHALPPSSISETVIYTVLDSGGTVWETGRAAISESGGTYTITRGGSQTVTAGSSGAGSAVTLTNSSGHTLFLTPDAVQFNRDSPDQSATTVTTGDVSAAVNTHYMLTISGMTADRNLVLPSGASAGDVISWELATDAPAAYELILKGDTGVTVTLRNESTIADEVTRYFIEGETGKAVYDGSEWRINKANDGRIPSSCHLNLTTAADGESASVWTAPTDKGGAWTSVLDVGGLGDTTNGQIDVRRGGLYYFNASSRQKDAGGSSNTHLFRVEVDGTSAPPVGLQVATESWDGNAAGQIVVPAIVSVGDVVQFEYQNTTAGNGCHGGASYTTFGCVEAL